uniref:Fermentation-respiration switch protein n=1 Tax=Pithovirus LCPAC201 TaxID=2506591 RepID=A0A481Z8A6_9VIRU|nr:MAG: fermentation-respiration switch protein [Pithovirus LCPAC201]
MKIEVWIIFIILVIIIVIGIFWWLSYWIIFYPSRNMVWDPSKDGYKYDDLYIPRDYHETGLAYYGRYSGHKTVINIWHFRNLEKNRRGHEPATVLFFHGNTGNISHRQYIVEICHRFGLNLVLVDCRGYGRSDGDVCPDGMYQDGETAYHYLKSQIPANQIIVWGESLGGTVACYVASKYKCKGLILMATFSSLEDIIVGSGFSRWQAITMSKMIRWIFHPMESKVYIKNIKCPVAIIHSKYDTLIPYTCSKIMYDSIPHQNKMLFTIEGDHSSPEFSDQVLKGILAFIGVQGECLNDDIKYMTEKLKAVCQEHSDLNP